MHPRLRGVPWTGVLLVTIIVVAAALRAWLFVLLPPLVDGDSFQYHRPAHRLMDGIDFPLDLKRPPAYAVLLAGLGKLFGPGLATVVAVQSMLGAATVALTYGIGALTFGRAVGLGAAAIVAISGQLLIWEHYIMTEALFTFLLSLSVFLFLWGLRSSSTWIFISCGLTLGLAALTRPHSQVLILLIPFVTLISGQHWRGVLRVTALMWLAAAAVTVPWMARNAQVHGAFTIAGSLGHALVQKVALNVPGSFTFDDPARPAADPNQKEADELIQRVVNMRLRGDGRDWAPITIHSSLRRSLKLSEAEAEALMRRSALNAIAAQPLTYAELVTRDFWTLLVGQPESIHHHWTSTRARDERTRLASLLTRPTEEQRANLPVMDRLTTLYQSSLLGALPVALFIVGTLCSVAVPSWRPALFPALAVLLLVLATVAAAGTNPRYHHPTIPLVHVLALGGLLGLWRLAQRLSPRRLPHPGGGGQPARASGH